MRGRGGSVTRARLARWWEALGRELEQLTVRGEKPRFAAALAPEGRVLVQLFEAAQRGGRLGVPRQVVDEARRRCATAAAPRPARARFGDGAGRRGTSVLPAAAATPPPAD
jgi:hypothetical protein